MSHAPITNQTTTSSSFWHEDARERLRVMLPELLLSIVAATCATTSAAYDDAPDLVTCIMTMGFTQLYAQTILYVFTYLTSDLRKANLGWGVVMGTFYITLFVASSSTLGSTSHGFCLSMAIALMMGCVLFYSTRAKWAFALLVVEIIAPFADGVPDALFPIVFVCFGSYLALFITRCAATRITVHYDGNMHPTARREDGTDAALPFGGAYGQVVAFATAMGAVCLSLAFASLPLFGLLADSNGYESDTSSATSEERTADDAESAGGTAAGNGATSGNETTSDGGTATDEQDAVEADTADDWSPTGNTTATGDDSSGASSDSIGANESDNHESSGQHVAVPIWILALLALPTFIALAFATRLLMRNQARRTIEREPREADRVAKIYLGALARLQAAGIERRPAETPREFLNRNMVELSELTEPAGIDLDGWIALTGAYEKARYADLDPTELELKTSWNVYDALPTCTRKSLGWPRYFFDVFWHM